MRRSGCGLGNGEEGTAGEGGGEVGRETEADGRSGEGRRGGRCAVARRGVCVGTLKLRLLGLGPGCFLFLSWAEASLT